MARPTVMTDIPVLAVDFDGVIHDKAHPIPGKRMGAPIDGTKDALRKLKRKYRLVIHTVMATTPGGRQAVEDWLRYYDIPFTEVTCIKPQAVAYIDDKAIRFTSWEQVIGDLK